MKVSHTFIADGNAMIIGLGFLPAEVHGIIDINDTELRIDYYKVLKDAAAVGLYGIIDDGAGVLAPCASAAYGISEYDSVVNGVLVDSPKPGKGLIEAAVSDWAAASTTPTARTATAIGTIVRPPTHNGRVFECTTATGTYTTEPSSWDVVPGETVTDGGSNVWTCRQEIVSQSGQKGISIGASISTDGDVWVITAETHDKMSDKGDAGDVAAGAVI